MTKTNTHLLVLTCVILLAAFLYLFRLSDIPNGVYSDEATVGYNAYSILRTGADEYGRHYPIAFRLFGAYTPPLFIYLLVPTIKFLGMTAFSLRVVSVVATLLAIPLIYKLTQSLKLFHSSIAPLLSALIFAISPWVVFNARIGYEVTLGYVLFFAGVYFIWQAVKNQKVPHLGLLTLSVSTYAAHTERFLVPIFLSLFTLIFWKDIKLIIKRQSFLVLLLLLFITQLPHFSILFTPAFWVKNNVYQGVSIWRLIHDFNSQYLSYLSPAEIFGISKDINLQHSIPLLGQFYSWLILPYLIGLYYLYHQRRQPSAKLIWLLLLVSPIPGALSGHFLSIQRVLPLIFPLVITIVLGLDRLLSLLTPRLFFSLFIAANIFSLILLWRSYFIFLPQERATWWSYGYSQLSNIISTNPQTIYVFDNSRLPPAYMSFLFHLQYPPERFQQNFSPEFQANYYRNPPYNPNYQIGNVSVRTIVWETDPLVSQVLVGDPLSISNEQAREHFLTQVFEIKDPLGNTIFSGFQTDPKKKLADNLRKSRQKKPQSLR